jgi:hypothetical protein
MQLNYELDAGARVRPIGFGYKNAWLATPSVEPHHLAELLDFEVLGPCDWDEGIEAAYAFRTGGVFITPPIDGWTLAVGTGLFEFGDGEAIVTFTVDLSRKLNAEVQFFGTHRVVEAHSWVKATPSGVQRAYMYVGDQGETATDIGDQTPEEVRLGFSFFDERSEASSKPGYWDRPDLRFPNEDDVMKVAALWSLDPSTLEEREIEVPQGLLCRNPREVQSTPTVPTRRRWWRFWS